MKTYRVTPFSDKSTYTVTLDEDGVVEVIGLLPASAESLKVSVSRHMERRGLSPSIALVLAVGSYSQVEEVDDGA